MKWVEEERKKWVEGREEGRGRGERRGEGGKAGEMRG